MVSYQPTFKCRCWTTCRATVTEADRRASLSTTVMAGAAISIAIKVDDQTHTRASYATYVANQIILHVTAGITRRTNVVVITHEVVDVAEPTSEVASTSSALN